jgi:hypothetical protein
VATVDSITNPDKMFTDGGINVIIDRVTQANGDKKKSDTVRWTRNSI